MYKTKTVLYLSHSQQQNSYVGKLFRPINNVIVIQLSFAQILISFVWECGNVRVVCSGNKI